MNLRQLVTALAVAGIALILLGLVLMATGCASTEHALNLATLDDLEGTRSDQHKVDIAQAKATEDAFASPALTHDILPATQTAIAKADVEYHGRTPPPTPGGGPDWNAIAAGLIALVGTVYGVRAHTKATATEKSLAATDEWVGDVEKKAEAK